MAPGGFLWPWASSPLAPRGRLLQAVGGMLFPGRLAHVPPCRFSGANLVFGQVSCRTLSPLGAGRVSRHIILPYGKARRGAEVLADYASRFGQDGFGDLLHGHHPLEKALGALHGA